MLEQIERKYGKPRELAMSFPMNPSEFEMLKESMRDGRNSDVTLFILKNEKVIVIAKPWYPEGLYRAPSGGIKPGEDIELSAKREAYEETGVTIELVTYLLRIHVTFTCGQVGEKWTSHIFAARYLSGHPHPIDTKEIKEVTLLTLGELSALKRRLLAQDSGGLHYRAALTEAAIKQILLSRKK
ncbi:MAG: NUDIX domain-containing protein [candidate division Zixibacteria bacterium]|nr:NUDIX domain-containing protein [candidate division Zixibacteria bacterium]